MKNGLIWYNSVWHNFYENIHSEMIGFAITVLILGNTDQYLRIKFEKQKLILQNSIPKELNMFNLRLSPRSVAYGLGLTAILGITLTLVVVAQDATDDGEPVIDTIDTSTEGAQVELVPDPDATDAISYFLFLSANTFVPYDDDMTYNYGGGGCVYRTGGASYMEHSLVLPQGAEISQVRLYFKDSNSIYNAEVQLYAFPGDGTNEKLADLQTAGTPGQGYLDSDPFLHSVDNSAEALSLRLDFQESSNDLLEICGVRVRYQYSPSISALPLILNGVSP